jgi:hypothetical protein
MNLETKMLGAIIETRDKAIKIRLNIDGLSLEEWFPKSQIKSGNLLSLEEQEFEFQQWIIDSKNAKEERGTITTSSEKPMKASSTEEQKHRPFYGKMDLEQLEEAYSKESRGDVQGMICKLYIEKSKLIEIEEQTEYLGSIAHSMLAVQVWFEKSNKIKGDKK